MGLFHRFLGPDPTTAPDATAQTTEPAPAAVPLPGSAAETATVRRIVARLEALPPAAARFPPAFAYVRSRAANADLEIGEDETGVMEQFVIQHGHLDESQAILVVEMAKLQ